MNGLDTVLSSLKDWLSQPFNPSMSAKDWFLFGGLILVIFGVWMMILREIKGAVK